MTVKTVNGLSNDTNTILGEWKTEFENLCKPPDISFDATFAQTAKTFVESSESNMERNDYEHNAILNSNITYDETVKVSHWYRFDTKRSIEM